MEAKFGLKFVIPSRVTLALVDSQIPWMLTQSILLYLAKEKGHRVRAMGVSSAVEHIFKETGKGQQSNSWSKSDGKGKSEESKGKFKDISKGSNSANVSYEGETSTTG